MGDCIDHATVPRLRVCQAKEGLSKGACMDEHEDLPTVEMIRPTADEVSEGYRKLQMCWPTWKQTPGLLVTSEDDLGLIVSAVEYAHDDEFL